MGFFIVLFVIIAFVVAHIVPILAVIALIVAMVFASEAYIKQRVKAGKHEYRVRTHVFWFDLVVIILIVIIYLLARR